MRKCVYLLLFSALLSFTASTAKAEAPTPTITNGEIVVPGTLVVLVWPLPVIVTAMCIGDEGICYKIHSDDPDCTYSLYDRVDVTLYPLGEEAVSTSGIITGFDAESYPIIETGD